jgi:hypothetical protein
MKKYAIHWGLNQWREVMGMVLTAGSINRVANVENDPAHSLVTPKQNTAFSLTDQPLEMQQPSRLTPLLILRIHEWPHTIVPNAWTVQNRAPPKSRYAISKDAGPPTWRAAPELTNNPVPRTISNSIHGDAVTKSPTDGSTDCYHLLFQVSV